MKRVKVGIASYEEIKTRTMAIARGEVKVSPDDPKLWFPSLKSFASVFSDENKSLLKIIAEKDPESIAELEKLTGRKASNLSRTLKLMQGYGFVALHKGKSKGGKSPIRPETLIDSVDLTVRLVA